MSSDVQSDNIRGFMGATSSDGGHKFGVDPNIDSAKNLMFAVKKGSNMIDTN